MKIASAAQHRAAASTQGPALPGSSLRGLRGTQHEVREPSPLEGRLPSDEVRLGVVCIRCNLRVPTMKSHTCNNNRRLVAPLTPQAPRS